MHDLDRIWHFFSLVAVKVGDIPWEEKSDVLLWRGTPVKQSGLGAESDDDSDGISKEANE